MSEDEKLVLVLGGGLGVLHWMVWYWRAFRVARGVSLGLEVPRAWLYGSPLACVVGLWIVLKTLAAEDVRHAPEYLAMYLLLGLAWLGAGAALLPWFGLSPRDDVLERRNPSAAYAISGALVGLIACYAGANIGNGPGWWVVLFSAGLATGTWALLWLCLARLTGVADRITIDRDPAVGARMAGYLVGSGLILGGATAGDWVSVSQTTMDFMRRGWPALVLLAVPLLTERGLRPATERSTAGVWAAGWLPGFAYALGGLAGLAAHAL